LRPSHTFDFGETNMMMPSTHNWATMEQTRDALASNSLLELLKRRLDDKSARIGIVCTGLAGLPFAERFALKGYHTAGFNLTPEQRVQMNEAIPNMTQGLAAHVESGYFVPQRGFASLAEQDAVVICIPAALESERDKSMAFIRGAATAIADHLRHGQLIVLEGAAANWGNHNLRATLEGSGLRCQPSPYGSDQYGVSSYDQEEPDFFLAFSSPDQRRAKRASDDPGQVKIVAGVNGSSALAVQALFQNVFEQPVRIRSSRPTVGQLGTSLLAS
jgi:UDP-N-acetyl-D-glucosamine dehydrogenase